MQPCITIDMTLGGHKDRAESLYYHIAKEALSRAVEASKKPSTNEGEFERKKSVTVTIVFSALALEAFINGVYADLPSGTIGRKQFRKLKHKLKWLFLPRMLKSTGTFDRHREPFATFSELVAFRNNRLVHFSALEETNANVKYSAREEQWAEKIGDVAFAERAFNCIKAMVAELHQISDGRTPRPSDIEQEYTRLVWSGGATPY
jgi:hypothetical protein